MKRFTSAILVLMCGYSAVSLAEETCHYTSYQWNTVARKAINHRSVIKSRSELLDTEIDLQSGCSVCEEDQIEIRLPQLNPFKVCRKLAAKIVATLQTLQQRKAPLFDVVAYRVGMTRGAIDKEGNRTQFSNHSFGTALDI